jgi:ketosteroid isomerase-like protein
MKKSIFLLLTLCCISLQSCTDAGRSDAEAAEYNAMLERLDALEAESEIRHKLQTYMEVLGASDWDNYVNYFTYDARLIMTEGTRVGRDDIKERMAAASARMAGVAQGRPARKSADLLANIEIQVNGNTATAQSRFTFIGENAEGGFNVNGSGLYIDEWAKEEGEWRISAREVDYDLLRLTRPQQ